jgi:hypothetical protein
MQRVRVIRTLYLTHASAGLIQHVIRRGVSADQNVIPRVYQHQIGVERIILSYHKSRTPCAMT